MRSGGSPCCWRSFSFRRVHPAADHAGAVSVVRREQHPDRLGERGRLCGASHLRHERGAPRQTAAAGGHSTSRAACAAATASPRRVPARPRDAAGRGRREGAPFWTYDFAAKKPTKITATLRVITDHAKWWVQTDVQFDLEQLRSSATTFENGSTRRTGGCTARSGRRASTPIRISTSWSRGSRARPPVTSTRRTVAALGQRVLLRARDGVHQLTRRAPARATSAPSSRTSSAT